MEIHITLTLIVLAVLFFLAVVESSHGSLSDVALRSLAAEPHLSSRNRFLRYLLEHRQLFSLNLSFGLETATIGLTVLLVGIAGYFPLAPAIGIGLLASFILVVIFRLALPRLLVQNAPGRFLLRLLPAYKIYFKVTQVAVFPIYQIVRAFRESSEMSVTPESYQYKTQPSTAADDTLQALIDVGEEEGIIEESDSELIQSIIEFGDTMVKEVMTQRTDMVCIEATASIEQARDMMLEARHSRLPVYVGTPDNIEKVVYVRDLLACWSEGRTDEPIESVARPAYFVPENKSVAVLLEDMQKSKTQIAVVIDEFGGVAGLVTIEDILEEIVGEIEDEDVSEESPDEMEIIPEASGSYLVRGQTEIRKLEVLFDAELEGDDFKTINGLITNELNRVPEVGENLFFRGMHIEVLETDGRTIRRVRIRYQPEEENDASRSPESSDR
ncbi:MAG: hemolysin family protein [Blastocatellia bacterium]|nr:hemolysin family protein [Blastocatellia bacterium]